MSQPWATILAATMTKNRRYEAHYDTLNDARIREATQARQPCTLPQTGVWFTHRVTA